jgi:hypothetical protein
MSEPIIKVEGLSKQYILNKSLEPETDFHMVSFIAGLRNLKNLTQEKRNTRFLGIKRCIV